MRWRPTVALITLAAVSAVLVSCVRVRPTVVSFPTSPIRVTARSFRPVEFAVPEAAPPPAPPASRPLPIPSLAAAVTPVFATAEAAVPSATLDPRLAMLYAQEQARVQAMTEGLKQISQWQRGQSAPALTRDQAFAELDQNLQMRPAVGRVVAEVSWSPLTSEALRSAPLPAASQPEEPARVALALTEETKREMEQEARVRAFETLRSALLRTEVGRGLTLRQWMADAGVGPDALDRLIAETAEVKSEVLLDERGTQHVCEVQVIFDQSRLAQLR